jgi:hypothetical protein
MSDFASRPDAALDQWLAAQHLHMATDLAATLDLKAGLREAMIPARHANLVADLGDVLNVEAGLSAIVPITSDPTPHKPETTEISDTADAELVAAKGRFETDPQQASPDPMFLTELESLVRTAASRSPSTRLAMRTHPAFDLDRVLDLAHDLDRALDRVLDLDLARALALDLACALALDLARALDRARALDLALDRAHNLIRAHDHALIRALIRALDRAHNRALTRALDRAYNLAHALARLDRSHNLDRARNLAHALARDLAAIRTHARDLAQMTRVVADLHHVLSDFTGVDLRSVDLAGIPLEGLRWSMETQWPPQWAEQVWRDSVEVDDGIFEVRGGNRYVPTTV